MNREIDDYNPYVQLTKYVDSVGQPNIMNKMDSEGNVVVYDGNNTWKKLMEGLDTFVATYCGSDLKQVAKKEMEQKYLQKLRKLGTKLS